MRCTADDGVVVSMRGDDTHLVALLDTNATPTLCLRNISIVFFAWPMSLCTNVRRTWTDREVEDYLSLAVRKEGKHCRSSHVTAPLVLGRP